MTFHVLYDIVLISIIVQTVLLVMMVSYLQMAELPYCSLCYPSVIVSQEISLTNWSGI